MSADSVALIDRICQLSKQPQFANDLDAQRLVSQLSRELSVKLSAPEDVANEVAYYVSIISMNYMPGIMRRKSCLP